MIWHRNDYSEEALSEMQREAEERVRDMQRRARLVSEEAPPPPPINSAPAKTAAPFQSRQGSASPFSGIAGFLGSLEPGSDRLVILALLWILWNEHADKRLLLALLYLLM